MVGAQVRRRRRERDLTLAEVAERTGLNVGYLSQIENDKASPSLETLAALAEALDVPITWFLLDTSPAPRLVRHADRPESVSPGERTGFHAHPGDEHHIVISGRLRFRQGDTVVEADPGDYVRLDGTLAHDVESVGEEPARVLIIYARAGRAERTEH
jgi:transcriptional regulator with XRE-family HTH domain